MTHSSKKNRIIFIDLIRAFAVLQMVQGHTVDVLLADEFRDPSNPIYAVWLFMRGMTAPIFLFSAGTVFTYLFRLAKEPFEENPRAYKGFKRFLLLVFLGYLLRYPTATVIYFGDVTPAQWRVFLSVDVLQLIGFGLFFTLLLAYLSEKTKLGDYLLFPLGALLFFLLNPLFSGISWTAFLPAPIANYLYTGNGSQFPLFPWAGYVLMGAALGSYLAKNPDVFKNIRFSITLAAAGVVFLAIALGGYLMLEKNTVSPALWNEGSNIIFMRLGIVLLLNALVSWISLSVESIPKLLILVGRNTLLIYIVHLVILYGSAWNMGVSYLWAKSFSGWLTFASALFMLTLMTGMVILLNKLKIKNKQLVT